MDPEPPAPRRRLFVQNYGCQMNDYDVDRMREVLAHSGYDAAASAAGRYKELKQLKPDMVVAIGGCVAQQEGDKLLKRIPVADFTFGPDQIASLPELLGRRKELGRRFAATSVIDVEDYRFLHAEPKASSTPATALV